MGIIFPAVEQLPSANEDARADWRHAVPGNIELGDVTVACLRSGQGAEDSEVLGERDTQAARVGAEDKDVRGGSAGDTQLKLNLAIGVRDEEFADGVRVEYGALGRKDNRRQTLVGEDGIDLDEERVAREAAGFTETGPAVVALCGSGPDGALLVGKGAPPGREAAKD